MGCHPTSGYGSGLDATTNQALIYQQRLRYNMISLWINNSLATDVKHKFRAYKTSYAYNRQDDGAAIFFVTFKNGMTINMHRILRHKYETGDHEYG